MNPRNLTFVLVFSSLVALLGWVSYVLGMPSVQDHYATVQGAFNRAEERVNDKRGILLGYDIYINEKPSTCFEVSNGMEYFDRNAFGANVRQGTRIQIQVLKDQLEKPAMVDSKETVYVASVRDDSRSYLSLDDYHRWEADNHRVMLYIVGAITGVPVLTAGLLVYSLSQGRNGKGSGRSRSKARTKRNRLA